MIIRCTYMYVGILWLLVFMRNLFRQQGSLRNCEKRKVIGYTFDRKSYVRLILIRKILIALGGHNITKCFNIWQVETKLHTYIGMSL